MSERFGRAARVDGGTALVASTGACGARNGVVKAVLAAYELLGPVGIRWSTGQVRNRSLPGIADSVELQVKQFHRKPFRLRSRQLSGQESAPGALFATHLRIRSPTPGV
jgi:hypothetical protein